MQDPESLDRLKSILERATSLPARERGELLEKEFASEPHLRREAERLLALHDVAGSFLPSGANDPEARRPELGDRTGKAIGPFTLLKKIGEGGFGSVYLAEQSHPIRRQVALKLVRLGGGSAQVLARFEAERQVLAAMDHPNIAVVFDAGITADGAPYFAMEYVAGPSLTKYADEQRLGIEDRLHLFQQLCEAVQHAHQKGVIHRDLKPSNVLVATAGYKPLVKVIDFGVAKALGTRFTEETIHTLEGVILGTPEYMSPEQASPSSRGVDTRTDVYSLGVILFELLVGGVPFERSETPGEDLLGLLQLIREKEPPRLTTRLDSSGAAAQEVAARRRTDRASLARRLRGDLEAIVLKALEKDPARRYSSAATLAEDVRRHLGNLPILARSPSTAYQIQKLVARHRGVAALAATLVVALVFFGIAMSIMYNRQRVERLKAENVNTFLQDMLASADPGRSRGAEVLARDILDQTAARISTEMSDQPELKLSVLETLYRAYTGLGLASEALTLARTSLAPCESLHGRQSVEYAHVLNNVSAAYMSSGQADSALAAVEAASEILASTGKRGALERALTEQTWAGTLHDLGRLDESETHAKEAVRIYRDQEGESNVQYADAINTLSVTLEKQGRLLEAEAGQREVLAILTEISGADHPSVLVSMSNLAKLLKMQRKYAEAESVYRATITIERRVLGDTHPVLAKGLNNLAVLLKSLGRYDEAEPMYQECLAMQRRIHGDSHPDVAATLANLGALYAKIDRLDEAERLYEESLSIWRKHFGEEHVAVATAQHMIAGISWERGELAEAEALERRALATATRSLGPGHSTVVLYSQFLAQILLRRGEPEKARTLIEACLVHQNAANPVDEIGVAWSQNLIGQSLLRKGDESAAQPLLMGSVDVLLADPTFAKSRKRVALGAAIEVCDALGSPSEGARLRAELAKVETE